MSATQPTEWALLPVRHFLFGHADGHWRVLVQLEGPFVYVYTMKASPILEKDWEASVERMRYELVPGTALPFDQFQGHMKGAPAETNREVSVEGMHYEFVPGVSLPRGRLEGAPAERPLLHANFKAATPRLGVARNLTMAFSTCYTCTTLKSLRADFFIGLLLSNRLHTVKFSQEGEAGLAWCLSVVDALEADGVIEEGTTVKFIYHIRLNYYSLKRDDSYITVDFKAPSDWMQFRDKLTTLRGRDLPSWPIDVD